MFDLFHLITEFLNLFLYFKISNNFFNQYLSMLLMCANFVNSILTFILNSNSGSSHSRVFLIVHTHVRYILGIPMADLFPGNLQVVGLLFW